MKPGISDRQRAQKQVELWTPWGVRSVARDGDPVTKSRKHQVERLLPGASKPAIRKPDLTPRA